MNRHALTFFCCLALTVFSTERAWCTDKRKALLIGIGEYRNAPWAENPLQASYGLDLMTNTLLGAGFSTSDLRVLRDGDATFRDIERVVHGFVETLEPGMQVMLYLYGHGVHVADDNGDEEDGQDEAFVPFDGQWDSRDRHLIRDDLLGQWVEAMRRKVGAEGFVLVLLDACHSGSGLRGREVEANDVSRSGLLVQEHDPEAAPMAVLYSSLPHQPSIEIRVGNGRKCALMTWSFIRAMQESGPKSTWRAVFELTASNMSSKTRKQIAVWEGETDRLVFGPKLKSPPPYFRIIGFIDSQTVIIDGGRLHGLAVGSTMHFYPPDTRDTLRVAPRAIGRISSYCGIVESMVELPKPFPDPAQSALWVFPGAGSLAAYPVPMYFSGGDLEFRSIVVPSTEGISGLSWKDSIEAHLFLEQEKDVLRLYDRVRGTLMQWSVRKYREEDLIRSLRERIFRWQIARFLTSWENGDASMQVSLLASKGKDDMVEVNGFADWTLGKEKDFLYVKVRNMGPKPVYYTLLDIDPEDEVRVLIPDSGRMPEEFRVLPGAESRTHRIRFDKSGRQVLKLMASVTPVRMESSIRLRGISGDLPKDLKAPTDLLLRLRELPLWNSSFFHSATLEFTIE